MSFHNHMIPKKQNEQRNQTASHLAQNRIYRKKLEEIRSISQLDRIPNQIANLKGISRNILDKRLR